MPADPSLLFSTAFERERHRLRHWVRRNVADRDEVEDILQDVFFELYQAYRLLLPIEDAGAWLFRVARNRVVDLFRRKRPEALAGHESAADEDGMIGDLLLSTAAGPEAEVARELLLDELTDAFEALPREQRDVFYAHEIEGISFKQIAARTGLPVSTLLARKHQAVLALRRHLRAVYEDYLYRGEES